MELRSKIKNRTAEVAVMGMGYVGFPLALEFARAGFEVVGVDLNAERVRGINAGKSHITDITDEMASKVVSSGKLSATENFSKLNEVDVISICVPTPLNKTKNPDVSFILDATTEVKRYLREGQLIMLESTTYPGTTEELILPLLEESGLKVGEDFYLTFSPERVDPGNEKYTIKNTPKIVGGVTEQCLEHGRLFLEQIVEQVLTVSSPRAAEMVKLLENTFRSVNIALVNEVALMCDVLDIDVWEIIEAAGTKPFGYMKFYPGPGLGGHCIPIDPHYLSWKLKSLNYYARFIELAGEINANMPGYVLGKVMDGLNSHSKSVNKSKVLLLGVAYKKDINDYRESPALDVIKLLQSRGGEVFYNDPYVPEVKLDGVDLKSHELSINFLNTMDCTVITTDHSCYDYQMIADNSNLIIDTRNAMEKAKVNSPKIIRL